MSPPKPGPNGRLLQEAWAELEAAAIARARTGPDDRAAIARLAAAAVEYASHRGLERAHEPRRPLSSDMPLPFGKHRGKPVRTAETGYLQWMHRKVSGDLDPSDRFHAKNVALLEAIAAELTHRGEPLEAA